MEGHALCVSGGGGGGGVSVNIVAEPVTTLDIRLRGRNTQLVQ